MKILWLCSWYPHREQPYEGDFIQRHAGAVSAYLPITVFYVNQDGAGHEVEKPEVITRYYASVNENVIYFRFRKTGIAILDKLRYNYRYYRTYKGNIARLFAQEGMPDIVHVHVPMKAGMIARWIKNRWGIPYILSEHSSHYNGNTDDDFTRRSRWYRMQVTRVFRDAAIVTNVSEAIAGKLKILFNLPDVQIIRNTVDTSLFYYDETKRPPKFRFIHVSTLSSYQKNVAGMLAAFITLLQSRQDFELVIVGPAGDDLKRMVDESPLRTHVIFTGEIPYAKVATQMQQSSAFVLFSRFENFPCVIIEALCCGLPVITSATGGSAEAINDTNGLVVQSENETQLVAALNKVMDNEHQYDRTQIAQSAKEAYSFENIGRQFYDLYQKSISGRTNKNK